MALDKPHKVTALQPRSLVIQEGNRDRFNDPDIGTFESVASLAMEEPQYKTQAVNSPGVELLHFVP
jgi:hypothetical protein